MSEAKSLSRDEFARMMSSPDAAGGSELAISELGSTPAAPAASDTVLDLDLWSRQRGAQALDAWNRADLTGDFQLDDTALASDALASLYEPEPRLAENPADKARAAWWRQLLETPEYRSLHRQTCLDPLLSSVAGAAIARQWLDYQDDHDGEPGDGDGNEASDESIQREVERGRSVTQALAEARDDVQATKDIAQGLGAGDGARLSISDLGAYFDRVRNSPTLRRILEMAGRFRRRAESLQKRKTDAARGEITGVELSGDLSRIVATELAGVSGAVPELEMLSLYRLSQSRCLSYRQRAVEPLSCGPIVVSVDESGSMSGERIAAAKGLALAMAWIARAQKRWIAFVAFGNASQCRALAMAPDDWKQIDADGNLIDWLESQFAGGTELDVPLGSVRAALWPKFLADGMPRGKTDHIVITDACVDAAPRLLTNYHDWTEAENVSTYSIVIGEDSAGDLAAVSDRVWTIPNLDLDSAPVSDLLSI